MDHDKNLVVVHSFIKWKIIMQPSLAAIELSANDRELFEYLLENEGITVLGQYDPLSLDKCNSRQHINSIACYITDDINTNTDITPRQRKIINIAERCGYIVGLSEGLDQQPGIEVDPIKSALRRGNKPKPKENEEEEENAEPNENDLPI